jgi:hypothetical protein
MAFELLRSIGHIDITAAKDVLVIAVSQSASAFLSRVAVLGQIGYLFELLFATAAVVLATIGVFRSFGLMARECCAAHIDEQHQLSKDEREVQNEGASERNVEVTVRLEDGFLHALRRHRCIVTVRRLSGGAQDAGREVWYARDAN